MGEQGLHLLSVQVQLLGGHRPVGMDSWNIQHTTQLPAAEDDKAADGLLAQERNAAVRRRGTEPGGTEAREDGELRALQVRRQRCQGGPRTRGAHAGQMDGRVALRTNGVRLRPDGPDGMRRPHTTTEILLHREDAVRRNWQGTHIQGLDNELRDGRERRGDPLRTAGRGDFLQRYADHHNLHRTRRTTVPCHQPATDGRSAGMERTPEIGTGTEGLQHLCRQ